ncbi:MAG: thiol protease/hemagglutinin PrtT [Bacteroidales bacterium]|nr:thiol protease/hemagglutinin PrtT [Bacteroidales bacterium]
MKKIALFFAALCIAAMAFAAPVDRDVARRVAVNFWNTYRPAEVSAVEALKDMPFDEIPHMYVFVADGNGFVIVSAADCVQPVLAYSFVEPFPAKLHPELAYWLSGYEAQISDAERAGLQPTAMASAQWDRLLYATVPDEPLILQNVAALLHTQWDQGDPYNRLCPYDSVMGARSVVGCVATAMAQIMKYWNHPSCGTGNHSYFHNGGYEENTNSYGIISADFEHTTYMWQDMPDLTLFAHGPKASAAVSTISFHCGVAVNMMYGPNGSGAYSSCGWWANACATHAFYEFFKYDPSLVYRDRDNFDDSIWMSYLDEELVAGHPIYYNGSDGNGGGHAFVCDGSDTEYRYHFNWGWDGYGNGFYALNGLNPGGSGTGGGSYSYNVEQGAIFGIVPIRETFDTVEYYDTVCTNTPSYNFYEYTLNTGEYDTMLRHLDTIFVLHLRTTNLKLCVFKPHGGQGSQFEETFCPPLGIEMPENSFTRENCRFIGWCLSADGDGVLYQPGEVAPIHTRRTFYAIWQDTTVGIPAILPAADAVTLWPNPTTGEVNVDLGTEDDAEVLVLDIKGTALISTKTASGKVKISLEGLPAGIYTVQAKTSEGVVNRRVIKQ